MEIKRMQRDRIRSSYNEWQNWCRLCANKNSSNQALDPSQTELLRTIEKHFDVILDESNLLPKGLCEGCLNFIRFLSEFSNRTFLVQRMYEEILMECQTAQSGILESIRIKYDENFSMAFELKALASKSEEGEYVQQEEAAEITQGEVEYEETRDEDEVVDADIIHIGDESVEVLNDFLEELYAQGTGETSVDKATKDLVVDETERFIKASKKSKNLTESEPKAMSTQHEHHLEAQQDREINSKPKNKEHKCETCGQFFSTAATLRKHRPVHSNERPFICEQCGFASKTARSLKEHMYSHTEEKPVICEICKKAFKNKDRLKRHQVVHFSTGHTCPKCGQVLKSRYSYARHLENHSEERRYKCGYCGRGFKMPRHLENHLIIHSGIRPYTCKYRFVKNNASNLNVGK